MFVAAIPSETRSCDRLSVVGCANDGCKLRRRKSVVPISLITKRNFASCNTSMRSLKRGGYRSGRPPESPDEYAAALRNDLAKLFMQGSGRDSMLLCSRRQQDKENCTAG